MQMRALVFLLVGLFPWIASSSPDAQPSRRDRRQSDLSSDLDKQEKTKEEREPSRRRSRNKVVLPTQPTEGFDSYRVSLNLKMVGKGSPPLAESVESRGDGRARRSAYGSPFSAEVWERILKYRKEERERKERERKERERKERERKERERKEQERKEKEQERKERERNEQERKEERKRSRSESLERQALLLTKRTHQRRTDRLKPIDDQTMYTWMVLEDYLSETTEIDSHRIGEILDAKRSTLERNFQTIVLTEGPDDIACVLTVELTVPKNTHPDLEHVLKNYESWNASIICSNQWTSVQKKGIQLAKPKTKVTDDHLITPEGEKLWWALTAPRTEDVWHTEDFLLKDAPATIRCVTFKDAAFKGEKKPRSQQSGKFAYTYPNVQFLPTGQYPKFDKYAGQASEVEGWKLPEHSLCESERSISYGVHEHYYLTTVDFNNLKPEVLAVFSWVMTFDDTVVGESVFRKYSPNWETYERRSHNPFYNSSNKPSDFVVS